MNTLTKLFAGCALGLGMALPASADLTLSLTPANQTAGLGQWITYDLVVSGLKSSSDYNGPALGAFSITLDYNSSIAAAGNVSFGTKLSNTGPDYQLFDTSTAGQIYLSEFSYDDAQTLQNSQSSSFTLATITLQGVGVGSTTLTFDRSGTSLSDESANTLDLVTATGGNLTVVPEPSFAGFGGLMAALGVAVMAWRGRFAGQLR